MALRRRKSFKNLGQCEQQLQESFDFTHKGGNLKLEHLQIWDSSGKKPINFQVLLSKFIEQAEVRS